MDVKALRRAFTKRTRAIIVNTPNNPTGKVFGLDELDEIAALCRKHDVLAVTDEVYEHIVYDGAEHVSIATLPGMAERTIVTSALSKTFSVTGWRLGYAIAPPVISGAIRKVHDFLTVGAPHPLQEAAAELLAADGGLIARLPLEYGERRDVFFDGLEAAGLAPPARPQGAYYVMVDISRFGFRTDTECARWMAREVGVAAVPASSFYRDPRDGYSRLRFAFCKKHDTLREATKRLKRANERAAAVRT
jgi:aminotransferase